TRRALLTEPPLRPLDEPRPDPAALRLWIDNADREAEPAMGLPPAEGDELPVLLEKPGILGEVDTAQPLAQVGHADARAPPEELPVPMRRLVRPDLGRDDRELERHADARHRRLDEVSVRVGEDRELPAAAARVGERCLNLGKRLPGRERARERILLAGVEFEPFALGQAHECDSDHLAVARRRALVLDLALE